MKYHQLAQARFSLTVPCIFLFFFFRLEMPDAKNFETNAKEDRWLEIYIQAVYHMFLVVSSVSFVFLTQLLTSRKKGKKGILVYPDQK